MMTRQKQIVLRHSSSSVTRRQPLLEVSDFAPPQGGLTVRLAEVVGGTTAECAAVCCCCPCGLVDLLVLAMCKVPAGLCRKALRRKRRRRLMKMGLLPSPKCNCDEKDYQIHPIAVPNGLLEGIESVPENVEIVELDKTMLDQFHSGGFWRSSSARM